MSFGTLIAFSSLGSFTPSESLDSIPCSPAQQKQICDMLTTVATRRQQSLWTAQSELSAFHRSLVVSTIKENEKVNRSIEAQKEKEEDEYMMQKIGVIMMETNHDSSTTTAITNGNWHSGHRGCQQVESRLVSTSRPNNSSA
jgi:hypothetical protein